MGTLFRFGISVGKIVITYYVATKIIDMINTKKETQEEIVDI